MQTEYSQTKLFIWQLYLNRVKKGSHHTVVYNFTTDTD